MKIEDIQVGTEYAVRTDCENRLVYTGICIAKTDAEALIRDDSDSIYSELAETVLAPIVTIPASPRKKWLGLF
jgi:hypothetical protein